MLLKPPNFARGRRVRGMISTGVAIVAIAALTLVRSPAALADPGDVLTAVGAGATEYAYDQFALDAAGNLLGSWDALNPVTHAAGEIITPVTNGMQCSFPRPNGGDQAVSDLRSMPGCVSIARTTTPPTAAEQSNTGPLVYVPFALDGVAGSTGPAACTPGCASYTYGYPPYPLPPPNVVTATPLPTAITTASQFTLADLKTMYDNCGTVTEGGITYDPTGTVAGDTKIDLYIPQPGSGTRSEWGTILGFNATAPPSCVNDHIVGGALATASPAVPVWENDGTAVATDPNGFAPFSISSWIAQRNLVVQDTRHMAMLSGIANTSPFSNGDPATGGLNPNFPITNQVYSVVYFSRVTTSTDPVFSLLNGSGSFVCAEQLTIIHQGFGLFSGCGEILAANRSN